jgi:hypothetical protein
VTRRHGKGWWLGDRPTYIAQVGAYYIRETGNGLVAEDAEGESPDDWRPIRCDQEIRLRCGHILQPGYVCIQAPPGLVGELFCVEDFEEDPGD